MNRRLEALRAMAEQDVSPNERDIARAKLAEMGAGDREPPRRPPAAPAPAPQPQWADGLTYRWNGTATATGNLNISFSGPGVFIRIRVD